MDVALVRYCVFMNLSNRWTREPKYVCVVLKKKNRDKRLAKFALNHVDYIWLDEFPSCNIVDCVDSDFRAF